MKEQRMSNGLNNSGKAADNAAACHAGGREFESRPDRKSASEKSPALFCLRYNRLRLSSPIPMGFNAGGIGGEI